MRACGQCARRGACADNHIKAEGAIALAAALQGNTTLQTLNLSSMWIARTRVLARKGGAVLAIARAEKRERRVVAVGAA
jgi:hypothetical protein